MHEEDCRLVAKGNVFIQHGQGLDIKTGKDLTVKRQLAYSNVKCKGSKNADHEIRLSKMRAKRFPTPLKDKLGTLDSTIGIERSYIKWLRDAQQQLELAKTKYEANARVIANKELFPGVVVSLNKQMYKVEKETLKSRILLVENNWEYQPII